ncbi:hypothetical protein [Schlesneria sp. T3-172]|uniref:hypothetical protein n=1 Tax=Schlesneria sphaerica TaxID=3373610 RepID=UPI0037C623C4
MSRTARIVLVIIAAFAIPASCAFALGFRLGESKDELNLKYDLSVYDHDTGRVTVKFTLKDEGRLKPVTSVDLHIASDEKNERGGFKSDLTMSMSLREVEGNRVAQIHIRKDWAERAEIQIKTGHLDGKQEPLTWYYHAVPLKDLVARAERFKTVE